MREELRSLTVGFRPFRVNNVEIIDASALLLLRADKHLEYSEIDCGADIRTTSFHLQTKQLFAPPPCKRMPKRLPCTATQSNLNPIGSTKGSVDSRKSAGFPVMATPLAQSHCHSHSAAAHHLGLSQTSNCRTFSLDKVTILR